MLSQLLFSSLLPLALAQGYGVPPNVERPVASEQTTAPSPTETLLGAIPPELRALVREVLLRNPDVARAKARARAAALSAPQVKTLPNPTAQMTTFLQSPETRVGPQKLGVSLMQAIPWLSKLSLKERAAMFGAAALDSDVESRRLRLVTDTRALVYELAFLSRLSEITDSFHDHLIQHEEIARARYSTGVGLGQDVIKLQAEITKVETDLLGIDTREKSLAARLNRLRDRPATTVLPPFTLPDDSEGELDIDWMYERSRERRPEVAAAEAEIRRAEALVELARKGYKPDFLVGLSYTLVDPRQDVAGRINPPEDNGNDVLGIQFGVSVPIWRKKLRAGVEQATELQRVADEARRELLSTIDAAIGDLAQRIPLSLQQLRLVEDLLVVQAEEALESVTAAYIASTGTALDLLDAEHILFNAQTAAARARADWAIALASLEGAVGEAFTTLTSRGQSYDRN